MPEWCRLAGVQLADWQAFNRAELHNREVERERVAALTRAAAEYKAKLATIEEAAQKKKRTHQHPVLASIAQARAVNWGNLPPALRARVLLRTAGKPMPEIAAARLAAVTEHRLSFFRA
jgi:hypothetical protein